MSTGLRLLAAAVAVTAAAVGAGSWLVGGDAPATVSEATALPSVAGLGTTALPVRRAPFCEAVTDRSVADALAVSDGRRLPEVRSYGDGDRARIIPGVRDVAHEYSCSWRAGGVTARAWVFAPPVTAARARALRREANSAAGCSRPAAAAAYGTWSTELTCVSDGEREASYRGLFGDAWLSCSLTVRRAVPPRQLADRADHWCAAVALAAASRPFGDD